MRSKMAMSLAALSFVAAGLAVQSADACPSVTKVETVASFDNSLGETPEDVYVDHLGNRYVSLAMKGEIIRIDSQGVASTYATLPIGDPFTFCSGFFAIVGPLTFDLEGNLYASVASCDLNNRGVWKVDTSGTVSQLARLPADSFPNGIAYRHGDLYVADSNKSLIWKIDAHKGMSRAPEVWVESDLISRKAAGQGFPGANGIQFFGNSAFVANTDKSTIVQIPIRPSGRAGTPELYATTPVGCDDFAFDILGDLYCASFFDKVVRVRPNGTSEVIIEGGTLDGPTSIAFGRGWGDFLDIYVTNASFVGFSAQNKASLERYRVGIFGAPVIGY